MSEYKTQNTETKLKDPNAPKWPKTSYMMFCQEKRVEYLNLKLPEFSKLMGAEWKKLSSEEKAPYILKSVDDKKRYNEEMKGYKAPSQEELKNKRRRSSNENFPKRPLSSYMYFCRDKRREVEKANPEFEFKQVNSELGRLWREQFNTQEQRMYWIELAEKDKSRYQEEKKKSKEQVFRDEEISIKEDLIVDSEL